MPMDSSSISHWCSLGLGRRSAIMRLTLCIKLSVQPANSRGFKSYRWHLVGVRNAKVFRTTSPLCSSLAGMEGESDQIAGMSMFNELSMLIASQTRYFLLENWKMVTPSGHLVFSCNRPVGSIIEWNAAVSRVSFITSFNVFGTGATANTTAAVLWMQIEFFYLCAAQMRLADREP